MKNSILSLMAIVALISCEKKETANSNSSGDSLTVPMDTAVSRTDSTAISSDQKGTVGLSDQDKKFADAAAQGSMAEVMLGKLASSNGTNASVKSFGAMMVKDHSKANEELMSWATSAGYNLPSSVNAEQQKIYDELKTKKGEAFDQMFSDVMIKDHKKVIDVFKKESADGTEASLKSFAAKTLPTLEHHLMEAEKTKLR